MIVISFEVFQLELMLYFLYFAGSGNRPSMRWRSMPGDMHPGRWPCDARLHKSNTVDRWRGQPEVQGPPRGWGRWSRGREGRVSQHPHRIRCRSQHGYQLKGIFPCCRCSGALVRRRKDCPGHRKGPWGMFAKLSHSQGVFALSLGVFAVSELAFCLKWPPLQVLGPREPVQTGRTHMGPWNLMPQAIF